MSGPKSLSLDRLKRGRPRGIHGGPPKFVTLTPELGARLAEAARRAEPKVSTKALAEWLLDRGLREMELGLSRGNIPLSESPPSVLD